MKLSGLALLASIAVGGVAAAPAAADVVVHKTVMTSHTESHGMMHHGKRKVCRTRWVNHHKVRRCTWQHW